MRVLLVEDDQFFAQRISELLRDNGVEVCLVQNAEAAIEADLTKVDCAIVDVMLPNDPQASGISVEESRGGFITGIAVARRLIAAKHQLSVIVFSSVFDPDAERWASQRSIPYLLKEDGYEALTRTLRQIGVLSGDSAPLAFIVHGHDSVSLFELKNYVQNTLKWREPIVLREQPSGGKTLIEKFENYSQKVDCIFVLLTPDDNVVAGSSNEERRRSRQNVIFEAGFFYGMLGRKSGRILLLHSGPIELPSDISGVVWIDIANGIAAAGEEIRKEIAPISRQRS